MLLSEAEIVAQRAPVEGTVEEIAPARPRKKAKRRAEFPDHVPHFKTTYELEAATVISTVSSFCFDKARMTSRISDDLP